MLVALIFLCGSPASAGLPWTSLARQVGQSEKGRPEAIRQLRAMKDLNSVLLEALDSSHRALALDVISALHLKDLIPELLDRIDGDSDGFLVLTLNSLLAPDNKNTICEAYSRKITDDDLTDYSPGAIVAMLEPLGRLGIALTKPTVAVLLEHPYPEVKGATISYMRAMLLSSTGAATGSAAYAELLLRALTLKPYQVRLQSVSLIAELSRRGKFKSAETDGPLARLHNLQTALDHCQTEKSPSVKKQCFALIPRKKGKA